MLLTGDIEAEQEGHLVRDAAAELPSRVLVAPPHGSKTSSTSGFVAAVAPQAAIVQAGYRNRFGHPAAPVIARYAERGITLSRSDSCGAWQWSSVAGATTASCERVTAARYWHHPITAEPRSRF